MAEKIIEVGKKKAADSKQEVNEQQVLDKRQAEIEKMYKPRAADYTPWLFTLVTVMVLLFGWQAGLENYISPESGLGYALGITGGVMMLVMLLYSLRKRAKWMRKWGPVRYWFRTHMILGVYGPVLILYHCNFQLGSQNSNIALFSMLVVAASGIVGRYFYGKIHYGLYGNKVTIKQLEQDQLITRFELSRLFEISPELHEKLKKYDNIKTSDSSGLIKSFFNVLSLSFRTRRSYARARQKLKKACRIAAKKDHWDRGEYRKVMANGENYLNAYYTTIRKIAGFAFFERLFSLWHVLHVPLFFMLIITASIHVLAVHWF